MDRQENDFVNPEDVVKVTPVRFDVLKIFFDKRKLCQCFEPQYEIDYQNRMVWCTECKAIVDPFEALVTIARSHDRINKQHEAMLKERESVVGYEPRLLVMRKLADRYRCGQRDNVVPCCPNCHEPFELPDLISGTWCSRRFLKPKQLLEKT